jgi:hypothetical protein
MQQNSEQEQMQDSRRGGMLRAARRCCYWFAYRLDVCFLFPDGFCDFVEADSRRFLLIRNVI